MWRKSGMRDHLLSGSSVVLSELLDDEAGVGQGFGVGLQRSMDPVIGHREAVPAADIGVVPLASVYASWMT